MQSAVQVLQMLHRTVAPPSFSSSLTGNPDVDYGFLSVSGLELIGQ